MTKLRMMFAAALVMGVCFVKSVALGQADPEPPLGAAEQAEEPIPPEAPDLGILPDQEDQPTSPGERLDVPPDEDVVLPFEGDAEAPPDQGDEVSPDEGDQMLLDEDIERFDDE